MKRRTTNMAVATALAASVLVLAGCGGGSDEDTAQTPAPNPTPATPPPASPPPASPPPASPPPASPPPASPPPASPPPASPSPATITLNDNYGPVSQTCTLGEAAPAPASPNVSITYATGTLTVSDPAQPPAVDIVFDTASSPATNPTGTDDQASNPTSANYTGSATIGSDPYVVTMSVSHDDQLLGILYNPQPADESQAEIDRIEAERVRCGNQVQ